MLGGDRTNVRLGVQPGAGLTRQRARVVDIWTKAFGLEESQLPAANEAAARYVDQAVGLMRGRGLDQEGAPPLIRAEQFELDQEMLAAQIEAERSFVDLLTEQQRAALEGRAPTAIAVETGSGEEVDTNAGHGF